MTDERTSWGVFSAVMPSGWLPGTDDGMMVIEPPVGESVIQVSVAYGSPDHVASAQELREEAAALDPALRGAPVREIEPGVFAIDAEVDMGRVRMLKAYRLWAGVMLMATYAFEPRDAAFVGEAKSFLASIGPAKRRLP